MNKLNPENGTIGSAAGSATGVTGHVESASFMSSNTIYNSDERGIRRQICVGGVMIPCECTKDIQCGCRLSRSSLEAFFRESDEALINDSIQGNPSAASLPGDADEGVEEPIDNGSLDQVSESDAEGPARGDVRAQVKGKSPEKRRQPDRLAKQVGIAIQDYRLDDGARPWHTGICFIDQESAFTLGALNIAITGEPSCPAEICVLFNTLLNSQEAHDQLNHQFRGDLENNTFPEFKSSSNAGEKSFNGLFAKRRYGRDEAICYYGGFGIGFREGLDKIPNPSSSGKGHEVSTDEEKHDSGEESKLSNCRKKAKQNSKWSPPKLIVKKKGGKTLDKPPEKTKQPKKNQRKGRKNKMSDEKIASDRKIVLDAYITKPSGEVVHCPCTLVGWEHPEISSTFPLASGHMINHSCISNAVVRLKKLEFIRDGYTYEIHVPVFYVAGDVEIPEHHEITFNYGSEMCMRSHFFKNRFQDSIARAQSTADINMRKKILKDVPKTFTKRELHNFLGGCEGTDCCCPECDYAANLFDPPFCRSVMNLGPNDMNTTNLRKHINYPDVVVASDTISRSSKPSGEGCAGGGSGQASSSRKTRVVSSGIGGSSKSPKSSGLSNARSKRRLSSPIEGDIPLKSKKPMAARVSGKQKMKKSPRRDVTRKVSTSGDGGGFTRAESDGNEASEHDECDDEDYTADSGAGNDDSDDSPISPPDPRHAAAGPVQRRNKGVCVAVSSSRSKDVSRPVDDGYTRTSRKLYLPYALVAFRDPTMPYNETREAWLSCRTAHDRAQARLKVANANPTWADVAARLPAGQTPVDAARKANEFLHPPPPIPKDP